MTKFSRFAFVALTLPLVVNAATAQEPINIGSRLELFVDDYLIEKLSGDAKQQLHQPTPRDVALVASHPWEGNTSAYYTIFQDGPLYRMYYRGSHYDVKTKRSGHPEVTCYAESKDGIHWTKPNLGLFTFNGSKKNNIIWDGVGTHNFAPFKDANPNASPKSRYKALGRGHGKYPHGLYAFESSDAIHWNLISEKPVITLGAFDSQNLAFWDPHSKVYREYHRGFKNRVRAIMTGTSKDFLKWTKPKYVSHPKTPAEHLYTNAVMPYPRAPHLLIGFPTRFQPSRGQQVEPTLMISRDGHTFHRWLKPLIPVTAPKDRDGNRSNYMAWGLVSLPSSKTEYSVYATEAYYTGPDSRIRRFTFRIDGFVSIHGGDEGGELITKPIVFSGKNLVVNFATNRSGSMRVDVLGRDGKSLAQSKMLKGDSIDQTVSWQDAKDVSTFAGQPVRLRFQLTNADLYSIRFVE